MGLFDSIFGGGFSSPISPIGNVIGNPVKDVLTQAFAEFIAEKLSPDKQKNRRLEKGDVIGVSRVLYGVPYYEHYGVYIGNNRVIHYTSEDPDVSGENTIMETDFSHFMRGSDNYFILNLEYVEPRKYTRLVGSLVDAERKGLLSGNNDWPRVAIRVWEKCKKREVFGAEETIRRARSRLGENKYGLLTNNCEHFAIWCKTGISQSHQVDAILKEALKVVVNV